MPSTDSSAERHAEEYAGFWSRLLASLIDSVLVGVVIVPILLAVYGPEYFDGKSLLAGPLDFLLSWVLPAIAVIVFWIHRDSTPGKMALGMRIADATTGAHPTTGQYVGRYFAYYVSMLPLFLGFLWVAWDARKQGWHDKLAGTVVLRRIRAKESPAFRAFDTLP